MALQNHTVRTIQVIGGGTAGCCTAHYLAKYLPEMQITWHIPHDNQTVGVGEASIPDVVEFLYKIDISINDIINHCDGTLKLGIKFTDWLTKGHEYYHQFGCDYEQAASVKLMCKLERIPRDIDMYEIAVHFDTKLLSAYMINSSCRYDNLTVTRGSVTMNQLSGDYVVDCTGFKRVIMSGVTDDTFEKAEQIPNNAALIYRRPNVVGEQIKPYTTAKALNRGWLWTIPLRSTTSYGYVHDGNYDVMDEFIQEISPADTRDVNNIYFPSGRYHKHAVKHDDVLYAAVGLSSAFIEPLESTGIGLIVRNICSLAECINGVKSVHEHNVTINNDFDQMIPFILTHYKYNNRPGPYWSSLRELNVSEYAEGTIFNNLNWELVLSGLDQHKIKMISPAIDNIKKIREGEPYIDWIQHACETL